MTFCLFYLLSILFLSHSTIFLLSIPLFFATCYSATRVNFHYFWLFLWVFSHKKFHLSPIHFPIPHTILPLICSYLTTLFYFITLLLTHFSFSHTLFLLLCYSATLLLSQLSTFLSISNLLSISAHSSLQLQAILLYYFL